MRNILEIFRRTIFWILSCVIHLIFLSRLKDTDSEMVNVCLMQNVMDDFEWGENLFPLCFIFVAFQNCVMLVKLGNTPEQSDSQTHWKKKTTSVFSNYFERESKGEQWNDHPNFPLYTSITVYRQLWPTLHVHIVLLSEVKHLFLAVDCCCMAAS